MHQLLTNTAFLRETTLSHANPTVIRVMSSRSHSLLKHTANNDTLDAFSSAIISASLLAHLVPDLHQSWLPIGSAHLENDSPVRGTYCFEHGMQMTHHSPQLVRALQHSQYVIDQEGAETDCDHDVALRLSNDDCFSSRCYTILR